MRFVGYSEHALRVRRAYDMEKNSPVETYAVPTTTWRQHEYKEVRVSRRDYLFALPVLVERTTGTITISVNETRRGKNTRKYDRKRFLNQPILVRDRGYLFLIFFFLCRFFLSIFLFILRRT